MTDALHPLGLTSHPEWEAARNRYDELWVAEFITPFPPANDDDHDDIPAEDFRPSVVTFVIAVALVGASMLAMILPTVLG